MGKFSTGLFAGAIIGMSISMLDRRSVKSVKRAFKKYKNMVRNMY